MVRQSFGKTSLIISLNLTILTILSLVLLVSPNSSADPVSANAAVIVPSACSFTGTLDSAHTATIPATQYQDNIGKTTFKVICNDSGGFAIYAIGNSGDTFGNNKLLATVGGALAPTYDIVTGTATSGNTSNWAMKLTAVSGTHTPTIISPYSGYSAVPSTYTKVANYTSATDGTVGASMEATYAAYIAGTQPAGTYAGKVKYTMVHPATEVPVQPQTTQSGKICYYANASDAVGTMGCQDIVKEKDWSSCIDTDYETYCYGENWDEIDINTLPELDTYKNTYTLFASNFSRDGYGFAGWSDAFDYSTNANANFYGPNEDITITPADYQSPNNGLSLYAIWVKSAGNLQGWTGCSSLASGAVTALTDQRDNNTYAVAKLADNKCWMIENLRLNNDATGNSDGSLAQGYGTSATYGNFSGLADAEPAWADNSTTANSLYSTNGSSGTINIGTSNAAYRFPRYNHDNTNSRASSPTANSAAMYSYGNYYTWPAAIAGTTAYTSNNTSVTNTSICPSGWHLPIGGSSANATNSEFWQLGLGIMGAAPSNNSEYTSSETNAAGKTATAAFRSYPNNFVYSGNVFSGSVSFRGSNGGFWSSTARSSSNAYNLGLDSSYVYPGTGYGLRSYGGTIRCVASGA